MNTSYLPLNMALNPIVVNVDAVDPVTYPARAGLRYFLKLMVPEFYGANTFKLLVEFEQSEVPPETVAGASIYRGANFELQDQLDSLLQRNPPKFGQTGIFVCDGLVTPYYVTARVSNNGADIFNAALPVEYAIKSGIADRDYSVYGRNFFSEYVGPAGRFMTWAEDAKRVQMDQPEFLYWVANCSPTPASLKLQVQIMYLDAAVASEVVTVATLPGVTAMTVYGMAVGPAALGLASRPAAVVGYDVWLADEAGVPITERRAYRIDPDFRRNVRFIVFANSLGGFDTICLTGQGEEEVKISRSVSDRYADYSFEPQYAEQVINGVTGERQLSVNTGWLKQYGRTYLQELMMSREVYIATDRAFLPLLPATEGVKVDVDDEQLIGRLLTFRYANPERNFSNLPPKANIPARAYGWRPKASACLLDSNGRRTGKKGVMLLEKYYLDNGSRFKPATTKPNVSGTEGYIAPDFSLDCKDTPFLSVAISRLTTYDRNNCENGQIGGPAMVVIPAGTYGSEVSQADANAKAEAAFSRMNSQEYANQNGTCQAAPELYAWTVPDGKWHYRSGRPAKMDIVFRNADNYPVWGNSYFVNYQTGPNIYAFGSNDLDFPVDNSGIWVIRVYGTAATVKRVRVYQNGTLLKTADITINQDGFEQLDLLPYGTPLVNMGKVFIRVDDL